MARIDVPLPSSQDGGGQDAGSSSSESGSSSSESDSEDEARLQRRDTLARGPEARAISKLAGRVCGNDGCRAACRHACLCRLRYKCTLAAECGAWCGCSPVRPCRRAHFCLPSERNMRRRKLQPSDSLRGTVDRVLQRAEAILGSAT